MLAPTLTCFESDRDSSSLNELLELSAQIVDAVRLNKDIVIAQEVLQQLAAKVTEPARSFYLNVCEALSTQDWRKVSLGFERQEFRWHNGFFFILMPHQLSREAGGEIALTAILGREVPLERELSAAENHIEKLFGKATTSLPDLFVFDRVAYCGHIGRIGDEAFFVPESWSGVSSRGVALLDIRQVASRLAGPVLDGLRRFLSGRTTAYIAGLIQDCPDEAEKQAAFEYFLHEVAHYCTGRGLQWKLDHQIFSAPMFGAVEEYRTDGVDLELAVRCLNQTQAARVIAAQLWLRLGFDSYRQNGPDNDGQCDCPRLILVDLLNSGAFRLDIDGRLDLINLTPFGLIQSTQVMRHRAVELTQREVNVSSPGALQSLYAEFYSLTPLIRNLFNAHVHRS